jgi:hypothetical protein
VPGGGGAHRQPHSTTVDLGGGVVMAEVSDTESGRSYRRVSDQRGVRGMLGEVDPGRFEAVRGRSMRRPQWWMA